MFLKGYSCLYKQIITRSQPNRIISNFSTTKAKSYLAIDINMCTYVQFCVYLYLFLAWPNLLESFHYFSISSNYRVYIQQVLNNCTLAVT